MNARMLLRLRRALWYVGLVVVLGACSRAIGGPEAFQETAEKARSTFEETLDRFGFGEADISVGPTLCQPTNNVALGGFFGVNTEPGQGLAIYQEIRDYWLGLPSTVRRAGTGFYDTTVHVDGGRSTPGGYDLYASFEPRINPLGLEVGIWLEVSTGCYRP